MVNEWFKDVKRLFTIFSKYISPADVTQGPVIRYYSEYGGFMIRYIPKFVAPALTDRLWDDPAIHVTQRHVYIMGKRLLLPRLTAWVSDGAVPYRYSGQLTESLPSWPESLSELREKIPGDYDACLINLYRDGTDSVSWHRDDEDIFDPNSSVASVSIGAARRFKLKDDADGVFEFPLGDGDLLIFPGFMRHTLPKMKNVGESRMNFTFRKLR